MNIILFSSLSTRRGLKRRQTDQPSEAPAAKKMREKSQIVTEEESGDEGKTRKKRKVTEEESGDEGKTRKKRNRRRKKSAESRQKCTLEPEDQKLSNDAADETEDESTNFTVVKAALRETLNRKMCKREKNIFIRLVNGDVFDLSLLVIMVSIFVNYFFKEYFKREGREKFADDWKDEPQFQSFFTELNAAYKTKSQGGPMDNLRKGIGNEIVENFLEILKDSGCKLVNGYKRSRVIAEMCKTYLTVLKNNIIEHAEMHFTKYMRLKLEHLNLSKTELSECCRRAWRSEDEELIKGVEARKHPAWPIMQEHLSHFKIKAEQLNNGVWVKRWWPTISYLIEAQDELFRNKLPNFDIFPQFHYGLTHVTYSASGLYDLATRFVAEARKVDGKSRRNIALERKLQRLEEGLKEFEKDVKRKRMEFKKAMEAATDEREEQKLKEINEEKKEMEAKIRKERKNLKKIISRVAHKIKLSTDGSKKEHFLMIKEC